MKIARLSEDLATIQHASLPDGKIQDGRMLLIVGKINELVQAVNRLESSRSDIGSVLDHMFELPAGSTQEAGGLINLSDATGEGPE